MPRKQARPLEARLFTHIDQQRFWAKVDKADTDECWLWTGAINSSGYGSFRWGGSAVNAHRWSYVLARGAVSVDLVVDHLCRNTACVNPAHLEAVTHEENVARGTARLSGVTECIRGHLFDEENTRWLTGKNGKPERQCRTCTRTADVNQRKKNQQDPERRRKRQALSAAYSQQPKVKERNRVKAAQRRATETPEQREARLQYLRDWRAAKKSVRTPTA